MFWVHLHGSSGPSLRALVVSIDQPLCAEGTQSKPTLGAPHAVGAITVTPPALGRVVSAFLLAELFRSIRGRGRSRRARRRPAPSSR